MQTYTNQNGLYRLDYIIDESVDQEIFVESGKELYYLAVVMGQSKVNIVLKTSGEKAYIHANFLIIGQAGAEIQGECLAQIQHSHSSAHVHMVTMLVEGSDCKVSGDVQIFPDIIKAEGRLLEENIVLGKKVKIHTLPKLDVRSNDVAASHGARIEKLDPKKLFYLESKGISKQEAKRLMLEGYVENMFQIVESIEKQETSIGEMKEEVMKRILG